MTCFWSWISTPRAQLLFGSKLFEDEFFARYKIDKIRGEEKEGYLKFERLGPKMWTRWDMLRHNSDHVSKCEGYSHLLPSFDRAKRQLGGLHFVAP